MLLRAFVEISKRTNTRPVLIKTALLLISYLIHYYFLKTFGLKVRDAILSMWLISAASIILSSPIWIRLFFHFILVLSAWSYFLEGVFFGPGMFFHLSFDYAEILTDFPRELIVSGAFLALVATIDWIELRKSYQLTRWPRYVFYFLIPALGYYSPIRSLIINYKNYQIPSLRAEMSLNRAKEIFRKINIDPKGFFSANLEMRKIEKNIVFIYMESVEANYLDQKLLPDLMPFLNKLKSESINFTNFKQASGGFTVAGLFMSQCGLSHVMLASDKNGNDIFAYADTSPITCLGDIFKHQGHSTSFVQGTDLEFAGTERLLRDHKFENIIDINDFTNLKKHVRGAYDRYVFEELYEEILSREAENKPFFISTINYDTHNPGYRLDDCPTFDSSDNILNAVHCYDRELSNFYLKLKNTAWKNSRELILVVLSDHLSMTRFQGAQDRRNILLIHSITNPKSRIIDSEIFHYDLPAIVLDYIGAKGSTQLFPFSYSPLSNSKRNIPLSNEIIEATSVLFHQTQLKKLSCGISYSFYPEKLEFRTPTTSLRFNYDNGQSGLRKKHYALITTNLSGEIIFKGYVPYKSMVLKKSENGVANIFVAGNLGSGDSKEEIDMYWGPADMSGYKQRLKKNQSNSFHFPCE